MRTLLSKFWAGRYLAAAAGAAAFALFLPTDAFKDVTQELLSMFGLLMAGILPTMVLTANALRPANLSVKKLLTYKKALQRQMNVWIGLFVLALAASVFVILGKMLGWSLPISIPQLGDYDLSPYGFDAIRVLNAAIAGVGALLVLRAFSLGTGILSLLSLTSELAVGEAQLRDEERNQRVNDDIMQMAERPGYGDYVDLH